MIVRYPCFFRRQSERHKIGEEISGVPVHRCMTRSSHFRPATLAIVGLFFLAGSSAHAENPLERLRRHIHSELFGRSDRKDDRNCKDRGRYERRDDDRERYEDRVRNGYYDARPSYGYAAPSFELRYDSRVEPAPTRSYRQELSLEAEVQFALQQRGYYRGEVDGEIGPETRAAIRHFQFDNELPTTGRIDRELLSSLRL